MMWEGSLCAWRRPARRDRTTEHSRIRSGDDRKLMTLEGRETRAAHSFILEPGSSCEVCTAAQLLVHREATRMFSTQLPLMWTHLLGHLLLAAWTLALWGLIQVHCTATPGYTTARDFSSEVTSLRLSAITYSSDFRVWCDYLPTTASP